MKGLGSIIISKALAGLILIVPLAILFIAAVEVYGLLEDMATFAELELPFFPIVNALIFILAGLTVVFSICLFTGILMSTAPGKKFAAFVEKGIADKIPLLGLIRNLTLSLAGENNKQLQPVEADLHGFGTCMFGFLMETLPDGRHIIFIPSAPAVTLGQAYIVPSDRVKLLDASLTTVANAITQWGVGAGEIYKKELKKTASEIP